MEDLNVNQELGKAEKMQLSHRMDNLDLHQTSKKTARDPVPTMTQNSESGMHMEIRAERSSRLEEIEREVSYDEQNMDLSRLKDSEDEEESEGETDSENEKNHDGVLATLAKLEKELDSIENSRNYSDGFFNNQIKGFDIKNRVKAEQKEIEVKTQEESKEAVFKEKNSGAYGCSDCNFTTTYLQSLKNKFHS